MATAWRLIVLVGFPGALLASVAAQEGAKVPAATAASAPAAPAGVKIVPASISESRHRELQVRSRWTTMTDLTLTLHVVGDAAVKARRYGRIQITEAVDDLGSSLVSGGGPLGPGGQFETIDEWKRGEVKNGFAMDVGLKTSARSAAKIARVAGTFELQVGGEVKAVLVKDVLSHIGKEVQDPLLAQAGIKLTIDKSTKPEKNIAYVIAGREEAVLEVDVVDAAGEVCESSHGSWRTGNAPTVHTREVLESMPENAGLRLQILSGAETLKVPIALKDIPLP